MPSGTVIARLRFAIWTGYGDSGLRHTHSLIPSPTLWNFKLHHYQNTMQLVVHQVENQGSRQAKPDYDRDQHADQEPGCPAPVSIARLSNPEELEECGGKIVQQGHGPIVRARRPMAVPLSNPPPGQRI